MNDKIKKYGTAGGFKTQRAYTKSEEGMSGSMEDYLEMIYRISSRGTAVRIRDLSAELNVSPSSASKMGNALKDAGFVDFERYGYITLTERGRIKGEYLYHRHNVVNSFLCMLNGSDDELSQTEKIEHYLTPETVSEMERILKKSNSI